MAQTKTRILVHRQSAQGQCYREDLGNNISLTMVQIPAGHFLMGAPKDELEQYSDEIPQHEVTLKSFFMGMYPITQNQWKVVS